VKKPVKSKKPVKQGAEGTKLRDYNPISVKEADAFVPTDAHPVRLQKKLAGVD
jgi:hypothetical protein